MMYRYLVKQAAYLPFGLMLTIVLWALFVPGYSSVAQHMSELQLMSHPIALVTRLVPIVFGLSAIAFGVGALMMSGGAMRFTCASALVFGVANVSNGVFVSGNPLHGLFGLAMFYVLVPASFAAEFVRTGDARRPVAISLAVAFFGLFYLWLQFSNLDPHGYRGLTQRVFVLVLSGWYTYAATHALWSGYDKAASNK